MKKKVVSRWREWGLHMRVADMWDRAIKGYPPEWLGLTPPGKITRIQPNRLLIKAWTANKLDAIARARRAVRERRTNDPRLVLK